MKTTNESGRSMVEMLGVLAIIGVLSIGGIAGYTTAMNRYRANEIIDMATKYATVAFTAFQTYGARNAGGVASSLPTFAQTGLTNGALNGATIGDASVVTSEGKTPSSAHEGDRVVITISFGASNVKVCKAAASALGYAEKSTPETDPKTGYAMCGATATTGGAADPKIIFITKQS